MCIKAGHEQDRREVWGITELMEPRLGCYSGHWHGSRNTNTQVTTGRNVKLVYFVNWTYSFRFVGVVQGITCASIKYTGPGTVQGDSRLAPIRSYFLHGSNILG
jgi:hypothetical protein